MPTAKLVASVVATAAWAIAACVGCGGVPVPGSSPVEELLLDESALPEGWALSEGTFDPGQRLAAEQLGISFAVDGCASYSLGGSH